MPDARSTDSRHFRVLESDGGVEVEEGSGNAIHLGPVLRRFTPAKLNIRGAKKTTTVEFGLLYDALGLLRALKHDVDAFNSAAAEKSPDEKRYACYRLSRQAAAFGVRVPRTGSVDVPGLDELIALVESKYTSQLQTARGMISGGVVDYSSLAELFRPGTELLDRGAATGIFGVPTAMRVRACYYSRGKSLFGTTSTFFAALEFVVSVGDRFAVVEATFPISEFHGTRSTTEGLDNFILLNDSIKIELSRRGEIYAQLASKPAFLEYTAGSFLPVSRLGSSRAPSRSWGRGRIMVDSQAAWQRGVHCARSEGVASDAVKGVLKLVAQRARTSQQAQTAMDGVVDGAGQLAASAEEESLELLLLNSLPPGLRYLTWPVVVGFSFAAKSWGIVQVSGLAEVKFNEEAFDRLVIPEQRKKLIKALVLNHAGSAGAQNANRPDIIAGKGEGTIFLLHGPPGVGKTLTAEAIAELLHKPLYVVSMGELGTTPESLEDRLQDILDLCIPWKALVLIDEAEMLLERRTKDDIVRNAMVCVMLRLLEYYTGILFLTTNRVDSLDPAFQSRVQCALRYEPLDSYSRAKIWKGMLDRLPHSEVDVEKLAGYPLNGRQIKNTLQLAVALAASEGVPVGWRQIEATVEITMAFVESVDGM